MKSSENYTYSLLSFKLQTFCRKTNLDARLYPTRKLTFNSEKLFKDGARGRESDARFANDFILVEASQILNVLLLQLEALEVAFDVS